MVLVVVPSMTAARQPCRAASHQVLDHDAASQLDEAEDEHEKDGGDHGEFHGRGPAGASKGKQIAKAYERRKAAGRRDGCHARASWVGVS